MLRIMNCFVDPKINDRNRFDWANNKRITAIVILCQAAFAF